MQWKSVAADLAREMVTGDRRKLDETAQRLDEAAALLRRHAQEVRETIAKIKMFEQTVVSWFESTVKAFNQEVDKCEQLPQRFAGSNLSIPGDSVMKMTRTRAGFALMIMLGMAISGCRKGIGYDKGGDELGASMTAHLKAQPPVSDATYFYSYGLDNSPALWFSVTVKESQISDAAMRQLYEFSLNDYWHSSAKIDGIDIRFYSSDKPPIRDRSDSARVVKQYHFYWAESSAVKSDDQNRLEQEFGPRPKPPPTPTK